MTTATETEQESGSALRARLEAAIARENAATKVAAQATIERFKGVKVEDLAGLDPSEFATKAAEIEQARATERATLLREALAEAGLADEELDTAISRLKTPVVVAQESAEERVASLGSLGGTVVKAPEPQLWGEDRVRAAIHASDKQR